LIIIIHSHHASVPNASRPQSSSVQTCALCPRVRYYSTT
jgi:hypothetical protein